MLLQGHSVIEHDMGQWPMGAVEHKLKKMIVHISQRGQVSTRGCVNMDVYINLNKTTDMYRNCVTTNIYI